jgi:hypothetical protein
MKRGSVRVTFRKEDVQVLDVLRAKAVAAITMGANLNVSSMMLCSIVEALNPIFIKPAKKRL